MQFLFIEKSKKIPVCLSVCLYSLPKSGVQVRVKVRDPNLGLTQLMYITKLVNSGDVQLKVLKVLKGAKECFCAVVSVFIATHGYEPGRIYFVVTCPNINTVHTCNQFAVVPYHF